MHRPGRGDKNLADRGMRALGLGKDEPPGRDRPGMTLPQAVEIGAGIVLRVDEGTGAEPASFQSRHIEAIEIVNQPGEKAFPPPTVDKDCDIALQAERPAARLGRSSGRKP